MPLADGDTDAVLKKRIEFTDALRLTAEQYHFSFGFSASEYIRPDKIQYAYKLEGLNDDWLYTDSINRVATYTTLPAGDYTFRVKASSRDGRWGDNEKSIRLTILPPWYLSWQALVAWAVLALTIITGWVRYRTAKLTRQARVLEQKVHERTQQLERSRDELVDSNSQLARQSERVSDLLAQKQQLFASVSHEFRTPLTLILSPVEQLLASARGKPVDTELSLIKRNSMRLLRMVDQLLEFAKLEQGRPETCEQVSLAQTLQMLAASFEPLFARNDQSLTIEDFDDVVLSVLPDSLNKILINLLSNAVKYGGRNTDVQVSVVADSDWVSGQCQRHRAGDCRGGSGKDFRTL